MTEYFWLIENMEFDQENRPVARALPSYMGPDYSTREDAQKAFKIKDEGAARAIAQILNSQSLPGAGTWQATLHGFERP